MGIRGLAKLLAEAAEGSVKEIDIKSLFGRKVAIDASMCIYQFLIAIRQDGQNLENSRGEVTSHLNGLFYRTIRMLDNGIKPVYVFDGKPPVLKTDELSKRTQRREDAEINRQQAEDEGDQEAVEKFTKRIVKVTSEHVEDCKNLLSLMGIPHINAPCEAEAQCAAMVKSGKVFAVGTEDMDALTFGADVVLRHLTFSEAKKVMVKQYTLSTIREMLGISQEQFVDLCILLGCDYCDSIRGVGPKTALKLIREHGSIEKILAAGKYSEPCEKWSYKEAREFFLHPDVIEVPDSELVWTAPDEAGMIEFMVGEKGFNADRINSGLAKIKKSRKTSTQTRLDGFFTRIEPVKRKVEDAPKNDQKKRRKARTDGRLVFKM